MQPVQLSLIPDPVAVTSTDPVLTRPPAPAVEQLPVDAVQAATTVLVNVIAKAATMGSGAIGDE